MINAHVSGVIGARRTLLAGRRVGVRLFWLLFAAEALLVAVALVVVLQVVLPVRTPLTQSGEAQIVRAAVLDRLGGTIEDPLVEVAPGVTVRSSQVRGLALNGVTYYYRFEERAGFDPLSRGTVAPHAVETVLREREGDRTLVIYRLLNA
jgi:hypothetical protein